MSDSLQQWLSHAQAPLSSTISWSLLKFMSIESVMLSNHLILSNNKNDELTFNAHLRA